MFEQLGNILEEAKRSEKIIKDSFNSKREKNTIDIQKLLNSELETISNHKSFQDYNPISIHNSITELKHERTSMDNEEDIELNTLFNSIWKKLITYNISSNISI